MKATPLPKSVFALELHEKIILHDYITVMRVPSGWIYCFDNDANIPNCVFVPFTGMDDMFEAIYDPNHI